MRILHTSDWHFGKTLEMRTRIDEQRQFVDELVAMVEEERIDLVIVAGDVYDTTNPTVAAEQLFFEAMKRLCGDGKRVVLVIAGNHDSAGRITAAEPIVREQGILLLGKPGDTVAVGEFGFYSIVDSGSGFFEIQIRGERAVVLTMPYPSEKTLGEVLLGQDGNRAYGENELQQSYSKKIGAVFLQNEHKYRKDTINLAVGHFFIRGGENSGSERSIELGGIYAVDAEQLPKTADYIAMGHLHRAWHVPSECGNIYYSGSPIQFRKSEAVDSKVVFILEAHAGVKPDVRKVMLKNYKPIEIWAVGSIEEAMERCKEDSEGWIYLEIVSDRPLTQAEAKQIHEWKPNVVDIKLLTQASESEEWVVDEDIKSVEDEFSDYYFEQRKKRPSDGVLLLFAELRNRLMKGDDFLETDSAEN